MKETLSCKERALLKQSSVPSLSANTAVQPITTTVNSLGHLVIGGCDTVELAKQLGTPLWVVDEATIISTIQACQKGLLSYPRAQLFYAGKAFLCLAMCRLLAKAGCGLDVVSGGELYTAIKAEFDPHLLILHGNNKSEDELNMALGQEGLRIIVDSQSELETLAAISRSLGRRAKILLRVIPNVEPDTHRHIQTGHEQSKFGIPLLLLDRCLTYIKENMDSLELLGLHAHIGSQTHSMGPYLETIDTLAETYGKISKQHNIQLGQLNLGGGLGIKYTEDDEALPIYYWSCTIAQHVQTAFSKEQVKAPDLLLEPGRAIVGTAGISLYSVGHQKLVGEGATSGDTITYVALDGGMADNPRPITYGAKYTAGIANDFHRPKPAKPITLVGKFCEQGDVIIEESFISPEIGDLVAIFGTGAYNYSMSSNYNRTIRPACVLVSQGKADIIIERESYEDLLRNDRVPGRLLSVTA